MINVVDNGRISVKELDKRTLTDLPTVKWIYVTPEKAQELLDKSKGKNRRNITAASKKRSVSMANDIMAGRWYMNGETIKMDRQGHVIDGQHRLYAIILAGVGVWCLFVFGVESAEGVDKGGKCKFQDELRFKGYKDVDILGPALTQLWRWIYLGEDCYRDNITQHTDSDLMILLGQLNQNGDLVRSVEYVNQNSNNAIALRSQLVTFHVLAKQCSEDVADWFVAKLYDGVDLRDTEPVYLARKILVDENIKRAKGSPRALDARHKMALVIKAWNYTCEGRSVSRIQWNPTGPNGEDFPRIAGVPDELCGPNDARRQRGRLAFAQGVYQPGLWSANGKD